MLFLLDDGDKTGRAVYRGLAVGKGCVKVDRVPRFKDVFPLSHGYLYRTFGDVVKFLAEVAYRRSGGLGGIKIHQQGFKGAALEVLGEA
jgi:hypothetical protein